MDQVRVDLMAVIKHLKSFNLTVQATGGWLWISGDTQNCQAELGAIGCKFSEKKQAYYYRHPLLKSSARGVNTLAEIQSQYATQMVQQAA